MPELYICYRLYMSDEHYKILGLRKGCSIGQVKKAYHSLAKKYHPDSNRGDNDAESKFREISEAYAAIKEDFRHHYMVLGLDYGASRSAIEKAFFDLTHKYNSSIKRKVKIADDREAKKYKEITEAYAALRLENGDDLNEQDLSEW